MRHLLCASDVEGWADGRPPRPRRRRRPPRCGMAWAWATRSRPATRSCARRSPPSTSGIAPDEVLVFSRRRGGDLRRRQRRCWERATTRSSSGRLPEPVRDRAGRGRGRRRCTSCARRTAGRSTSTCCAARSRPRTRLIVVNAPHNPTGACCPTPRRIEAVAAIAADAGAVLLSDEVYRFLEFDPLDRLPAGADVGVARGVSVGVMSKSFALAGPADRVAGDARPRLLAALRAVQGLHDDLRLGSGGDPGAHRASGRVTTCSPAPGRIVDANLALLDGFFARRPEQFGWVRPRAGRSASRCSVRGVADRPVRRRTWSRPRACCCPRLDLRPPGQPLPHRVRADRPAGGARPAGRLRGPDARPDGLTTAPGEPHRAGMTRPRPAPRPRSAPGPRSAPRPARPGPRPARPRPVGR